MQAAPSTIGKERVVQTSRMACEEDFARMIDDHGDPHVVDHYNTSIQKQEKQDQSAMTS